MDHKEEQAAARALKKTRREEHEKRAHEKLMKRVWIPHPEGVLSDGMGRYWDKDHKRILPHGRVIAHSIEGFLCLK